MLSKRYSKYSLRVQGYAVRNDPHVLGSVTQSEREATVAWAADTTLNCTCKYSNYAWKKKKSEVSRKPAEDLASLHPDFEIADTHSSLSSAKTLLHVLATISFYSFPSFKEKAHTVVTLANPVLSHSVVTTSHSSCSHTCWLPGGTSPHGPCQNFLRNFLREKDHMES